MSVRFLLINSKYGCMVARVSYASGNPDDQMILCYKRIYLVIYLVCRYKIGSQMIFTYKNIVIHSVILIMSFMLLVPCVWLLNASYYTSISKVNYWEEREVVGLLTYILNNSDVNSIRGKLNKSMDSIRYLAIKIDNGPNIIVDKKIEGAQVDTSTTNTYDINHFKVMISRRMYPEYTSDYDRYLKCYKEIGIYFTSDINKILNDSKSFLYHRNLIILITHLALIFMLEIVVLCISVKYRLSQLMLSIDKRHSA